MNIEKMTRKQLNDYINKLEKAINLNNDNNEEIYKKWLNEALEESKKRYNRKFDYLKKKGLIN